MNDARLRFDEGDNFVALAIERNPRRPHNTFLGIVYRDGERHFHFHLGFHREFHNRQSRNKLLFAIPDLPPERSRFYARLCVRVREHFAENYCFVPACFWMTSSLRCRNELRRFDEMARMVELGL